MYKTPVYTILCKIQRHNAFIFSFSSIAAFQHSLYMNARHFVVWRGVDFSILILQPSLTLMVPPNASRRFLMLRCKKYCDLSCCFSCKRVGTCAKAPRYQSRRRAGDRARREAALVFHL